MKKPLKYQSTKEIKMKTLFLPVFTMMMILSLLGSAQRISDLPKSQQPKPAQNAATVQPASQDSIIFQKLEHNYGTIQNGGDGNSAFTFTNKGQKPLLLSNVSASCGCTVPEWPKEPILPGKSGSIKVTYNTAIIGSFRKTITVSSNAANSTVVLTIYGNVTPKQ